MKYTKEEAIKHLKDKLANIQEEGSEDGCAWQYRADLVRAIADIEAGKDIEEVLSNI